MDLAEDRQRRLERQERMFKWLKCGRFSHQGFRVGESKTWCRTGDINDARRHEGGTHPVSYMVSNDANRELLRNGKCLRLRRGQDSSVASSESSGADRNRRVSFEEQEE